MGELLLHPILPFLLAAAVAWFAPRPVGRAAVVLAPLVALVQLWLLEPGTTVQAAYLGFELTVLRADALAMPFGWVFAVAALLAGTFGLTTMGAHERAAALTYVGAAMGVVFAGDLLTFFIGWELKAIASSFVVLQRRGGVSNPAGTRYLFVHLVGGKLLLAGVLWHHATTGSLAFGTLGLTGPTSLILVAFLLSAAVPPLHAWLPDAYPAASVAGTVFLSAFTTKAAVYALARGFPGTELLIVLGVVMAVYGVIYAMVQNDTRRLLAYHIVSQVGFMVTGIGIGTEAALNGAVAHAVAHIIYKGLLLMGVGAVLHATGYSKISAMGGLANRLRAVLVLYLVGAVSISSVPLFSGFTTKELVTDAASLAGMGTVMLLLKLVSVGTFLSTGLKLPYTAWFGADGAGPRHNTPAARIQVRPVPTTMFLAMGAAALINVAIGLAPGPLYELLPYPVEYDPYTLGKVLEKTQTLVLTGLVFWVLLDRFAAKPKLVLDLDVLYRDLPARLLAARRRRVAPDGVVAPAGTAVAATSPLGSVPGEDRAQVRPGATDEAPVAPTGVTDEVPVAPPGPSLDPVDGRRAAAAAAATTAGTATLERDGRADAPSAEARPRLAAIRGLFAVREGVPPVPATWLLGAVVLGTGVVLLLVSLLS
jgi:multicomponent Na+:H+ antiporter subunit D